MSQAMMITWSMSWKTTTAVAATSQHSKKCLAGTIHQEFRGLLRRQYSVVIRYYCPLGRGRGTAQWEESFFPKTSVAIVFLFWLKWAGYLALAGLNLLAQLSDRSSPYGV